MIVRGVMIALSLSVLASSASADPKDDVLKAMAVCADMSGKAARLKCFDEASPTLRALFSAPGVANSAPPVAPVDSPRASAVVPVAPMTVAGAQPAEQQSAEQKQSFFGLNLGARKSPQTTASEFGSETVTVSKPADTTSPPKEIDEIEAHVVDYATTPLGKLIVFLDNGQIWCQINSDSSTIRFHKIPSENIVVIKRGALGSYSMIVNNRGALAKVKRTK